MVWVPPESDEVLNEAPLPMAPLMLEVQVRLAEMLPSSASVAVPLKLTGVPTGTEALKDPALHTEKDDWATGTALAEHLSAAPAQTVRGYPEWKDKVATPALQEFYSGAIDAQELRKRLVKDGNLVLARYQR